MRVKISKHRTGQPAFESALVCKLVATLQSMDYYSGNRTLRIVDAREHELLVLEKKG